MELFLHPLRGPLPWESSLALTNLLQETPTHRTGKGAAVPFTALSPALPKTNERDYLTDTSPLSPSITGGFPSEAADSMNSSTDPFRAAACRLLAAPSHPGFPRGTGPKRTFTRDATLQPLLQSPAAGLSPGAGLGPPGARPPAPRDPVTVPEQGRHVPGHGGRLGPGSSSRTDVFQAVSYLCIKAAKVTQTKKRLFGALEEVRDDCSSGTSRDRGHGHF